MPRQRRHIAPRHARSAERRVIDHAIRRLRPQPARDERRDRHTRGELLEKGTAGELRAA